MSIDEQKKIKKEIMPYDLYNEERIKRKYIPIDEIRPYLNINKMNEMIKNAKEWGCLFGEKIDIISYSLRYCLMDVEILYICFNRYRATCIKDFDMDVINHMTISSFVDYYFRKNGCYEGCYKMGLNIKEFIIHH